MKLNILPILNKKKTNSHNVCKITDANGKDILMKIQNIRLPFNIQVYNNNHYINCELLLTDTNYEKNINLINSFEKCVIEHIKETFPEFNKNFISIIKNRSENNIHLKTMIKKNKKNLLIETHSNTSEYLGTLDLNKLSEYHNNNTKYDIILKPEILWENDEDYGIIFYLIVINQC